MEEKNIQIDENNNLNNENEKNDENESKLNDNNNNNNNNENISKENEINNKTSIEKEQESDKNYEKDPILNKNYIIKLDDLNKFKDDILTHIYLIESKINASISNQQEQISTNTLNLTNKITVLEQKNSHLSDQFSKITFDNSKISELLTFKKKAENELISQKIHLDSSIKDLSNSIYKHDKIILENLNVPGQIGTGAKYKNLSEYLSQNIKSMKNILNDQKFMQDKLKEHEKYIDNKSHQLKILIDEVILQNKNYTDIKFQLYSNDNENLIKIFNDKVMQLKIENVKQAQEMIKKTDEVLKGLSNLEQIKNDVYKKLSDHLFIYKTDLKEALEKYHKSEKEFKQIKYRFGTMIEFIKDIRFRKNLENYVNNNNKRNLNDRNLNDKKRIRKNEIKELTVRLKVNRKKSIDSAELKNVDLNYDAKTGKNNNNNNYSDDEDYEENKKKVSNIFRRISKNKITFIQDDDFIQKKLEENNNDFNDNNENNNEINDNIDINSSNVSNKNENDSNYIIINNNNNINENNFSSENNNNKIKNLNYKNLKLNLNDDFNNNNKNIINTENNNFVKNYKLTLNEEKNNELPIINNNNNNKSNVNSNNKSNVNSNNKNKKLILFSKENSIEEDKEKIDYKIVNLELKTNLEKFYENEKNKNINLNKNFIQKEKNFINLNNKEFNKTFYNKNTNKKSLLSNLTFIKSLNNNNNNNKISQKNKKFNVILVNKNRLNFDNLNGIIKK